MNFRDLACEHLSQYKVNVLRVQENGVFPYRGQNKLISHILPREPIDHRKENILEKYRDKFWNSNEAKEMKKLHRFFHHLNSSQALCINLFYPLIAENALNLFSRYLGIEHGVILHNIFEKKSDIEKAARRTSFDFYVQFTTANIIYVEVKYTEHGFGRAKNDDEHKDKFRDTYLPVLLKKSSFLVRDCQEEQFFLKHYQILRNLVHISDTDNVVLLFPSANTAVKEEAEYAKEYLLTNAGRAMFKIVFLEEFVSFLKDQCKGTSLDGYYQDFSKKYLPH
jgi:hypothetical protein